MNNLKAVLIIVFIIFVFYCTGVAVTTNSSDNNLKHDDSTNDSSISQTDPRSFQHGISILGKGDGKYYVIWSSSGNPPSGELPDGNWSHDIFYSILDPRNPVIKPINLISRPEAQEPSSADQTSDGHIMVTMEDGWNVENDIGQRYAVFDKYLKPILPYPQMVFDGGHSGHVAAAGNRFVIFYSNDWIDGGGFNDLGSGKDVLACIYDSNGKFVKRIEIAVNNKRNSWPVIAGSETNACLVWQSFEGSQTSSDLMFSILNPTDRKLVKASIKIHSNVKFYYYSVAYLPTIQRFIIMGTDNNGYGFGYLLDKNGNITAENLKLPPIMRESQLIIGKSQGKTIVGMITAPTGAAILSVTQKGIKLEQSFNDSYNWQYCGTSGIFINKQLYILSLSTEGIIEKKFDLS